MKDALLLLLLLFCVLAKLCSLCTKNMKTEEHYKCTSKGNDFLLFFHGKNILID